MIADTLMLLGEVVKRFIINSFFSCKGQNDHAGDDYMDHCDAYHFYCFITQNHKACK
jgi:hypothetical protein